MTTYLCILNGHVSYFQFLAIKILLIISNSGHISYIWVSLGYKFFNLSMNVEFYQMLLRWRVYLSLFDLLMWKSILICILILKFTSVHGMMICHFNGLLGSYFLLFTIFASIFINETCLWFCVSIVLTLPNSRGSLLRGF